MAHPCKLYDSSLPERETRGKFNENEVSELTHRTIANQQLLAQMADGSSDLIAAKQAGFAAAKNFAETLAMQNMGSIVDLAPTQRYQLQSFFARNFDQKQKLIGANPSLEYSVPGEVRYNLLQAARVADGLLDTQGKMFALKNINTLRTTIKEIMTQRGIKTNVQELMYETLESGMANKNVAIYGNTDKVKQAVAKTVIDWQNKMLSMGFTEEDLPLILSKAQDASSSFEALRLTAESFNLPIPQLFNIGFVPRELTPDFKLRVKEHDTKVESLFSGVKENPLSASTNHQKSRSTWKYIPEDEVFLRQLTGLDSNQLNDLLDDGIAWRNYLGNNFSTDQLDLLVDSGVMSKLPMTTREVFEYMVKTYELPYKELNEMFILDPHKTIETYSSGLARAVRNSSMIQLIGKQGLDKGWAVTEQMVKNNPELASFVKLGSLDHPSLKDSFPAESGNLYVHPIVADQLIGLAKLSSSPAAMGNVAKVWLETTNMLRQMFIGSANILYLGRQFMSNAVSLHAMGAGVHHYLSSSYDVMRAYKYGMEAFDNVKPYRIIDGQTLTKRQFLEKVFINRGVPFTPLVPGERPVVAQFNRLNPKNVGRLLNYVWSYAQDTPYGSPIDKGWRAGKYVGNVLKDGLHEWYSVWAGLGSFIDMSSRIAAYKSLSQLPEGVGQLIDSSAQLVSGWSLQKFDTMDKLNRYIDDYLVNFDSIGDVTSFTSRFVRPFASYAMSNFPMQIRHLLRHPGKFATYNKLISLISEENLNNDQIAEGEMNSYDLDEYPIVLKRDPVNKQTVILSPTNFDPLLGTVSYLKQNKEKIEAAMGWYPTNTQKQRARIKAELGKDTPLWYQEMYKAMGETYIGPLAEALTGIDTFTGRQVKENPWVDNTYLGLKVPVVVEALLSLVPPVDALNRWNPGAMFGLKEIRNARGEVIRPEKLSIFGSQRDNTDTTINDPVSKDWALSSLRMLGLRVRAIDGLANMGYNYEDTKSLVQTLNSTIQSNQLDLAAQRGKISAQEYESRKVKIEHMIDVWLQFEWDLGRIENWMVTNKVPSRAAFDQMKKASVVTSDLPMPGADFIQQKLKEAETMRRKN